MTKQTQERSILTEATFRITNHDGENVEAYRELAFVEKSEGGWLLVVTEPNQDEPEGDVLSGATIEVPGEAAGVFDQIFTLVADPAVVGAGTR